MRARPPKEMVGRRERETRRDYKSNDDCTQIVAMAFGLRKYMLSRHREIWKWMTGRLVRIEHLNCHALIHAHTFWSTEKTGGRGEHRNRREIISEVGGKYWRDSSAVHQDLDCAHAP